jgi:hypothetical protein
MDACITPQSTCLFGQLIIELKRFDSGTSTSGQANNDCAVCTPPKNAVTIAEDGD